MTRAVIYARYSSEKQTDQSIEGQLAACYEYAEREGYAVVCEYTDRARSAKTDSRPEFLRMVEDSGKKYFDVILVYQLDRFSRNRYDSATYKARLKKNGVRVVSVRENIADDPSGVLMEAVLEGMAEYYSAELSQKVRRGMDINASKCLSVGGVIPFGFKVDENRRFLIDSEKAHYVQQIFEMYAAGRTVKEITDYLNEKQIRTAKGGKFNKNSLQVMLVNKKYIGTYIYKGAETPGAIPRIVSDELFYKVGEIMAKNKTAPARARAKEEYLLTTKLFCGHCRSMMIGISGTSGTGRKHFYYSCKQAMAKQCNKKNVRKEYIEDRVIRLARAHLTDEKISEIANTIETICKEERQDADYKRFEKLRRDTQKQKANLVEALKHGKAAATLLEELSKLEDTLEDIERQLVLEKARHMDLTSEYVTHFLSKLRDGDFDDIDFRRILITVLVNAIYLYDDRLTVFFNATDKPTEVTESLVDSKENDDFESSSKLFNGPPRISSHKRSEPFMATFLRRIEDEGTILGNRLD